MSFENTKVKMNSLKPNYLSEDIDPACWKTASDAYNDLSIYAYHFIESPSNKYRIPEELVGDEVLMACERAFKYRYSFNIKVSDLHSLIDSVGDEIDSLIDIKY